MRFTDAELQEVASILSALDAQCARFLGSVGVVDHTVYIEWDESRQAHALTGACEDDK